MALEGLSLRNMFSYEEYQVYSVLEKLVPEEKNLRPEELNGFVLPPDFYVENGIEALGLEGQTVVETKPTLSFSALKAMESFFDTHSRNGYNVLVVYFKMTLSKQPAIYEQEGKKMMFVSYSDLKKKTKARIKTEDEYYFENAKKTDWKDLRKDIIEEASMVVNQGNNALFLGAGVSTSAGMPKWSELLKNLMSEVKALKGDTLKAFMELDTQIYSDCGDSNLIMARYLETAILQGDKNADFMKLIQEHLYSAEHTSDLLTDLALIVKARKVDEVVTYNFDDILEQELMNKGLKESVHFTSIARDAEIKDHNNLPIYHVHGIIPEHSNVTDTVVFSEAEYHERYRNAYHWSNIEQLHALTRKNCFFVGLSMNDPNLRRLLDIARKMNATDKPSHYAFLPRTQQEKYCVSDNACRFVKVPQSLLDRKKQKDIYDLNYTVMEKIFRQLGVNVIWFEDFKELPRLVEDVFCVKQIQGETVDSLLLKAEQLIQKIEDIESKAPKFNVATMNLVDYINYLNYSQTYGNEYRTSVIDCGEILQELSNRKEFELPENIAKLVANNGKFDNLSGYGDLYKKWYECIKEILNG